MKLLKQLEKYTLKLLENYRTHELYKRQLDYDGKFDNIQKSTSTQPENQQLTVEKTLQETTFYSVLIEDGMNRLYFYDYGEAADALETSLQKVRKTIELTKENSLINGASRERSLKHLEKALTHILEHAVHEEHDTVYVYHMNFTNELGHTTTMNILDPTELNMWIMYHNVTLKHEDNQEK